MAVVRGYLKTISGNIASRLNFRTRRNGTVDLSTTRGPGYARSTDQDVVRIAFQLSKDDWNALTEEEKQAYHAQAEENKITNYNEYLHQHLGDEIEGCRCFRFGISRFDYGRFCDGD